MSLKTILMLALGAANHVAADFYIYKGGSNVPNDGGGGGVATNGRYNPAENRSEGDKRTT